MREPARLLVQRRLRRGAQFAGIAVKENPVADIDREILRTAGRRRPGGAIGVRQRIGIFGGVLGAGRDREGGAQHGGDFPFAPPFEKAHPITPWLIAGQDDS